jgi:hypothetical protein
MAAIDRDYWLEFAKTGVGNSITKREEAASRLDTFLLWLWGIYTTSFALATLFNFVGSNIWQLIWATQPILIIMLARYFCTDVSMPSINNEQEKSADPNDVASIIDSFIVIVADKKRKLRLAKIFTLISIVSLCAALVGYNYCDPNKALKQRIQVEKLNKELSSNAVLTPLRLQTLNDSIHSLNTYYDNRTQNWLKQKRLECLEKGDTQCLETLKRMAERLK